MLTEKSNHVIGPDSDDVDDPGVRKAPDRSPFVDGGGADAEQMRDLADREELLDRR